MTKGFEYAKGDLRRKMARHTRERSYKSTPVVTIPSEGDTVLTPSGKEAVVTGYYEGFGCTLEGIEGHISVGDLDIIRKASE